MNELGYIILKDGKLLPFGQYLSSIYRSNSNVDHFHDTAFRKLLMSQKKDFSFISNANRFEIISQLPFMAKNNCVVILNSSQGAFEVTLPVVVMSVPEKLSKEQKKTLINIENTMNYFDNGLSYIDIIDSKGDIVGEYHDMYSFYGECVDHKYNSTFSFDKSILAKMSY